ncbi:MAG: ABC transporter ATP-binding protein [Lachnospiraceae bacterium]|nr:ABC transporter ATP-binding protein [Lachnospiraceae bacterium]
MDYAMKLENVTKHYSGFSLDHVNIELPAGCIMGFVGENGAGKSTTIKLILDLVHKEEGRIYLFGKNQKEALSLMKENIGVVMDECCFPENLNVSNVNTFMKRIYKTWDADKFQQMIQKYELPQKKAIKDFSKGMKMKLSIACALAHDTKLLLLDEATSGLDPVVRDEILDTFLEFIQDETHSIFMSSHILSDLEKVCDYICFIHKGKIVFSESKDELLEKYGVLKCSEAELRDIPKSAIKGVRKNRFGVEALVLRERIRGNYVIDRAGIEDIMLFYIKEGR